MALTVGQIDALATKGIESEGGVRDAIFKNHAFLNRLKPKAGKYSGTKLTFPFEYKDDSDSTGSYYQGGEALSLDMYDPYTELSFDLKEVQESLVITHRDLALNQGKQQRINLLSSRLKTMEKNFRQRMVKGIFSDGTANTGAMTAKQLVGIQAFLKASAVNYGNVSSGDVSVHVAYVNDNGGSNRALTTALHQAALGGASEGDEKPTVGVMRQAVMNEFIELIKPHQKTVKEGSLDGMGHAKNTLVYSGVDHIVDNLSPANSIAFLNEKHVRLYNHPDYNMKSVRKSDLETMDALLHRLFWKGAFACDVLRFQSWLKDIQTA